MTSAWTTALQQADPTHYTDPWYYALVPAAMVIALAIWRWRRGGGGGPSNGPDDR
jgi:hypothetical protein